MTSAEVILDLKARGVTLWEKGGKLRYRAPAGALTEQEKVILKEHKASILKSLAAANDPPTSAPVAPAQAITTPLPNRTTPSEPGSTAPFNQQALNAVKAGTGCWVWSGVLSEWIFVVRDEGRKTKAVSCGIDPGLIWTLAEVTGVAGMPPEGLRGLAKTKHQFGGVIVRSVKPERWCDVLSPLEPAVVNPKNNNRGP